MAAFNFRRLLTPIAALAVCLLGAAPIRAQADSTWARHYAYGVGVITDLLAMPDGGCLFVTPTPSSFHLIRTDASGAILWQKQYQGGSPYQIQATPDGQYYYLLSEARITKVDADGDVVWWNELALSWNYMRVLASAADGGVLLAGQYYLGPDPLDEAWVLKLTGGVDGDGKCVIEWQKIFPSLGADAFEAAFQEPDGHYTLAGKTSKGVAGGPADAWIVHLDTDGTVLWQKTYGGAGEDGFLDLRLTSDGGYIACGFTQSFGAVYDDAWVVKLDGSAGLQWQKRLGEGNTDQLWSIAEMAGGGFAAVGHTDWKMWGVRFDPAGQVLWQHLFGANPSVAHGVRTVADGGLLLGGFSGNVAWNEASARLIKMDAMGEAGPACSFITPTQFIPLATAGQSASVSILPVALDWQFSVASLTASPGAATADLLCSDTGVVSVVCNPVILSLDQQDTASSTCTVASLDFTGTVTLSCEDFPAGTSFGCAFNPPTVTLAPGGNGDAQLTLSSNTTDGGRYDFHVRASGGTTPKDFDMTALVYSQNKSAWARRYATYVAESPTGYSEFLDAEATPDGGYIMAGWHAGSGYGLFFIVKTDADGNLLWQKQYANGSARRIRRSADGLTYRVYGDAQWTTWLMTLDLEGNLLNLDDIGAATSDASLAMELTPDGGTVLTGYNTNGTLGSIDTEVLKLTPAGAIQWQKKFSTAYDEYLYAIVPDVGGYTAAGCTKAVGEGGMDAWLVRMDLDGNPTGHRYFGGPGEDQIHCIRNTAGGGTILAGSTTSYGASGSDGWVVKMNPDWTVEWQKRFGLTGDEFFESVRQTADGGFIVAGRSGFTGWMLKLNSEGAVQWQKTYGPTGEVFIYEVLQTADSGYLAVGTSGVHARAMKLDPTGDIKDTCGFISSTAIAPVSTTAVIGEAVIIPTAADWTITPLARTPTVDPIEDRLFCANSQVFTILCDPMSFSLAPGFGADAQCSIHSVDFAGDLTLGCVGLPAEVTCAFAPPQITGMTAGATVPSTLTVDVGVSAGGGTTVIQAQASSLTDTKSADLILNILQFGAVPNPVVFPGIHLGEFAEAVVTITNAGTHENLTLSITSPAPPFTIVSNTCPGAELDPGQTCAIGVRFAPTVLGAAHGGITLTSNEMETMEVTLTGTGTNPIVYVTVVSPDGGESWEYSENVANRKTHIVSWDASSFFNLDHTVLSYSADGGTTWTCIADSSDTNCADGCCDRNYSGGDILLPSDRNFIWEMPTQGEASAAGQSLPSAGGLLRVETDDPYANTGTDDSDANFYIIQPTATSIRTLIAWDPERICERYDQNPADPACACALAVTDPECEITRALAGKLVELKDHSKVMGVTLDLSSVAPVQAAYAAWDLTPTDQDLANAAAGAIRTYLLDQANNTYTNTQYVILVGDDRQIPFHRIVDGAVTYAESSYPAEVGLGIGSTIGSALSQGYFLTDNPYGELNPEASGLNAPHDKIYLNDFAVGRLVETPAQIEGIINTFLAQNGQVNALPDPAASPKENRILVTGLDFLHDSAAKIGQDYDQMGYTDAEDLDQLIDDPAPGQTGDEYTPAMLSAQLFPTLPAKIHRVANINTHANHFSYAASQAASGAQTLLCTDAAYSGTYCHTGGMDANPVALTSSILYTSGCHSGLTVPETDAKPLDLPEQMAKKGVVAYIGNTGYGWGIKNGRGLTEDLMENITNELLAAKSISIGKALAQAKRSYVLKEKRWDVFDEKVMHELTLFGIPNYLVVTGAENLRSGDQGQRTTDQGQGAQLPLPTGPDQGCANGICLTKTLSTQTPGATEGVLPPGMTELALNFEFGTGTYQKITTPDGAYYQLNGRSSGEVGDAIQPHFAYNSYLSGTNAHGVLFTGGTYTTESPFDPVIAVPRSTNVELGEGPLPAGTIFVPTVRATFGTTGGLGLRANGRAIGQVGYTNLLVHTGFYETNTESRFGDMQFVVYYTNSVDIAAPAITDPGAGGHHALNAMTATFTAEVTDASQVYRVVVTYHDKRTSQWGSVDLTNTSGNTWTGTLALKGSIEYYLQAVDKAGNIGMRSVTGGDLDGLNQPYGSTWSGPKTYSINLADSETPTPDGLPDLYENAHACLDAAVHDSGNDPDYDGLTSLQEFEADTDPCTGDTDGGGENDGSELHANGTNPKRDPLNGTDDKHLTITIAKVDEDGDLDLDDYQIAWPTGEGDNGKIDGAYFVYRSETPFFEPGDRINGTPIPDGTSQYIDIIHPCADICYYNVWNYALNTPAPIVESVAPNPAAIGTTVSVYGDYFESGAVVLFGTTPAAYVVFMNSAKLRCTVPAGSGTVDITVRNPNEQEGTLTSGFTYP